MPSRVFQPNFTGGILGPDMYSRSDTTKYAVGVKRADNVLIRPQGGLQNRPGFRLASGFDTGAADTTQWLMPFTLSSDLSYVLEFSEDVFRVILNGAYVIDSAFTAQDIVSITEEAIARIEMVDATAAALYAVDDLLYINDPAGDHVLGEQVCRVTSITDEFITVEFFDWNGIDTSTGGTATWGATGAGAVLEKVYSQTHPYDLADVPFVRFAQDNVDMYLVHSGYPTQKLTFTDADDWTLADFVFGPSIDPPADPAGSTTITGITKANPAVVTFGAAHNLTVGSTIFISGVSGMTQVNNLHFVVGAITATTIELLDTGGATIDSTGYGTYTSGGTATTLVAKETASASGTDYKYKVAALTAAGLEESLPSVEIAINSDLSSVSVILCWPAVADAGLYVIYRYTPSGYSYIGATASTIFTDNNITPDNTIQPKQSRDPFPSADNYPSVVAFVEQRLALGATNNDPQLVELSQVGAFTNFNVSYPSAASDALRFRFRARELNVVRSLVSGRALLMFTSSAEWVITGNENEGVLTPTSIVPRPESYWGSYSIEPVTVGANVLFVEPSGNAIRDFLLTLNPNAPEQSRDITILVRDLFAGWEITSWCYTKSPDRTVWVTLNNGDLLSLCYMGEHDIWGWTKQELGGTSPFVYQVISVREGARDVLYAIVGRTGDTGEVIMTERLDSREDLLVEYSFYLDAGLTYDEPGVPASALSGLLHLRGQTVWALVDGNVVEDLVVGDNGVVDFGTVSGDLIHVGLPYEAIIETLDIDFEVDGLGSMQGRFKAVSEVAINVKSSRGLAAGVSEDRMNELIEWTPEMVGGPIPLETKTVNIPVDGDWVRNGTVIVKQRYPLPMTVLGIAPEWEPGE